MLKVEISITPTRPDHPPRESGCDKPIAVGDTTRPASRKAIDEGAEAASSTIISSRQPPTDAGDNRTMWPPQQLSWADEQPPPPLPDIQFGTRLFACSRELIGLRLVTTYRDFVCFVPRRLDQRAFQPGEWPLDPLLSWDEIAEAILDEQVRLFLPHVVCTSYVRCAGHVIHYEGPLHCCLQTFRREFSRT
jgi:hypothetical protein